MNFLQFFKEDAKDQERRDTSEGASQIDQVSRLKIQFEDKTIEMAREGAPFSLTSGQLRTFDPNYSGNIYSMMGPDPLFIDQVGKIDARNCDFGDTALLILEPKTFIDRLIAAIEKEKHFYYFDKVKYYDEREYSGPLDIFHKPQTYAHQLEFRFFIPSQEKKPLTFNLGSLEDITKMIPAQDLPKLKFDYVQRVA